MERAEAVAGKKAAQPREKRDMGRAFFIWGAPSILQFSGLTSDFSAKIPYLLEINWPLLHPQCQAFPIPFGEPNHRGTPQVLLAWVVYVPTTLFDGRWQRDLLQLLSAFSS